MSRAAAEAIVEMIIRQMGELGARLREIEPLCAFDDYVEYRIDIASCWITANPSSCCAI